MSSTASREKSSRDKAFAMLVSEATRVAATLDNPGELVLCVTELKRHLDRPRSQAAKQAGAQVIRKLAGLLENTDAPETVGTLCCLVGRVLGGIHDLKAGRPKYARSDLQYSRRDGRDGPELIEARPGSSKPFHIGMTDFDAAIAALSQVGLARHATFKEVHAAFLEHGGANTSSSYQLRTVLRFLKQAKPALINAIRDGYKVLASDAEAFKKDARQALMDLGPRDK